MLRSALVSTILALSFACGPVAPAPDGATVAPASSTTTTGTGGHSSGALTSTGVDASSTGTSTGSGSCTGEPPCPASCATDADCGLPGVRFCSGGGQCVDANGTLACSACAPLPCDGGCPDGAECVAVGAMAFCAEPTTGKPLCTGDEPCVDANGTVTCV